MIEQFKREKSLSSENLEDQKYREFQKSLEVLKKENYIMREIDNVLASTPNRAEAEKIILEEWAPLMEEAIKKSHEAMKSWLDSMSEATEHDKKELDNTEKDLSKE